MSPTILLEKDEVRVVVGSPGGSTIITSVFQALVNLIDFKMTPQQAVDATRVHHQLFPVNEIITNPVLDASAQTRLQDKGYSLREDYLGDIQLVVQQKGQFTGASDSRGRGESRVFEID